MKNSSLLLITSVVMGALSFVGFIGHILFRIAHWPGSGWFRIVGLGGAVIGFGAYFLYKKRIQQEKNMPPATPKATQQEPTPSEPKSKPKTKDAVTSLPDYGDLWEKDEE
jgi:hypothetical protein